MQPFQWDSINGDRTIQPQNAATLLSRSKTEDYREAGQSASWIWHTEDRPPFTLLMSELMEFDGKVTQALGIRDGFLKEARVKYEGGNPEVCKYAQQQFDAIWLGNAHKIARAKLNGWAGFEILYRQVAGSIMVADLKDFAPRDVRPLVARGKVVGMTVKSIRNSEIPFASLWAPKCMWITYKDRSGSLFGHSLLEHAYPAWYEKWMRGGVMKLRQLRMMKDAWRGDHILYPMNPAVKMLQNGRPISHKDFAREVVENTMSGGVFGLPSDRDEHGNLLYEYKEPKNIDGSSQIFDWGDKCNDEILEGLETPKEVIEAVESGLGGGGRSIPFIALLGVVQQEFEDYAKQIDRQAIKPLCRMKFGKEPECIAKPQALIEIISKLVGGGGGDKGSQRPAGPMAGMFGGGSAHSQNPMQNPMQTSSAGYGQSVLALSDPASRARVYKGPNRLEPRQVKAAWGATAGGVYYPAGVWIDNTVLQFADSEELDVIDGVAQVVEVTQLDDAGRWITIGGRTEGKKDHAGGFPVKIDGRGVIIAGGPKGLQGKHVSEIGDHFAKERADRESGANREVADFFDSIIKENEALAVQEKSSSDGETGGPARSKKPRAKKPPTENDAPGATRSYDKIVRYQADRWGMPEETYRSIADELFAAESENLHVREEAREYAREITGLRKTRIAQLERQGLDHSGVKGLDTFGRGLASMYPALGWGAGYEDQNTSGSQGNVDYGEKVWNLVSEGQQRLTRVSPEFHEKVDEHLEQQLKSAGTNWKPESSWDAVQFSDHAREMLRMQLSDTSVLVSESKPPREFSSTQFDIPHDLKERFLAMAARIHPDDLAYPSISESIEFDPHITVKYGLHTSDAEEVRDAVQSFGVVAVVLGDTTVFPAGEKDSQRGGDRHDVLKIDINGDAVRQLNKLIAEKLQCTDTFPAYVPHATIAYLKPGLGEKYAGMMKDLRGTSIVFDRLTFSSKDRTVVTIGLNGGVIQFADRSGTQKNAASAGKAEFVNAD